MRSKRFLYLLILIIISLALIIPAGLGSCTHEFDRGTVWPAIEMTLSLPGDNPVKDDLINRGLVKISSKEGETGYIHDGQIEELVKEGFYRIDKNGYLQFGPSYIPITVIPTLGPNYTTSAEIQQKLQEISQAFGRDIPIPHYLPEGYEITEALYVPKQQYSGDYIELTITKPGQPDIQMSISWHIGPFRILPIFEIYQYFEFDDGNGTYGSVIIGYNKDHNDLVWQWIPGTLPPSTLAPQFYEMSLSASIIVPAQELVNIARFVTIK